MSLPPPEEEDENVGLIFLEEAPGDSPEDPLDFTLEGDEDDREEEPLLPELDGVEPYLNCSCCCC